MQYESAKFFLPSFSFHDAYEQFAKFFARQIFPLYGNYLEITNTTDRETRDYYFCDIKMTGLKLRSIG